jgi:RNA polymerase sigma factor (sigma-70 family)
MEPDTSITTLMERIRAGDEEAAATLVRQYETELRREIRLRLRGAQLRSILDSVDICQSVLASFFLRTAMGHYQLETPLDVLKLLTRMARNKIVTIYRRQFADRRDASRTQSLEVACVSPLDQQMPPDEAVSLSELLESARSRLRPRELQLADLRRSGLSWLEIAAQVGGTPNGQCRTLARAVTRICQELQIDG